MPLIWDFSTVADRLGEAVRAIEDDLRVEQAVYGFDAKDELTIQAMLSDKIKSHYEVAREVLRAAYHAVPEHLRMYCGDMDSKDWPIRRILGLTGDDPTGTPPDDCH